MFTKSYLRSGFSIVQGLILTAIVSGSALIMVDMVKDQKLAQTGSEVRGNIDHLHEIIFGLLQYRDNCKATFESTNTYNDDLPANLATNPNLNIQTINYTSGVTLGMNSSDIMFKVQNLAIPPLEDLYMKNTVGITQMELAFNPDLKVPSELKITYNRRTKKGYGGKDFSKTIDIVFQKSSANEFISCYAVQKIDPNNEETSVEGNQLIASEFCASMGSIFTWDPDRNICSLNNLRCNPPDVFVGITAAGTPRCEPLMTWGFDQLIDPTPDNCTTRNNPRFVMSGTDRVRLRCN